MVGWFVVKGELDTPEATTHTFFLRLVSIMVYGIYKKVNLRGRFYILLEFICRLLNTPNDTHATELLALVTLGYVCFLVVFGGFS